MFSYNMVVCGVCGCVQLWFWLCVQPILLHGHVANNEVADLVIYSPVSWNLFPFSAGFISLGFSIYAGKYGTIISDISKYSCHFNIAVIPLFLARKPEVQEVRPGLHRGVCFTQSLPKYQVGGGGGGSSPITQYLLWLGPGYSRLTRRLSPSQSWWQE